MHRLPGKLALGIAGGHRPAMRYIVLAATLLLAGCMSRPQQHPAAQLPPPVTTSGEPRLLLGLTANDLLTRFGRPALEVQEGSSVKLQFRGACVLDAYLYPSSGGVLRVTHVDTRVPAGATADQPSCIRALELPS